MATNRITVTTTSELIAVSQTEDRNIPATIQGHNTTEYLLELEQLDGSAFDLTGCTLTGVILNATTSAVVLIDAPIDLDSNPSDGHFKWKANSTDTGTFGTLYVTFRVIKPDATVAFTQPARWVIQENPSVTAIAGSTLQGVTPSEAALLTLFFDGLQTASVDDGFFNDAPGVASWRAQSGGGGGGSTISGVQVPPTSPLWNELVIPDTVGDGSGIPAVGISGSDGVTRYVNFATNTGLPVAARAPVGAIWAICTFRIIDLVGSDNVRMRIAPRAAQDPPLTDIFAMKPNVTGAVQGVFLPIGTTQTWAFRSVGPGGSFFSQTWQLFVQGYFT